MNIYDLKDGQRGFIAYKYKGIMRFETTDSVYNHKKKLESIKVYPNYEFDHALIKSQPKMPQVIKDKWLEALRNGDYEQGKGTLKKDDKFCCLGVLCDIYQKETGKGEWLEQKNDEGHKYYCDFFKTDSGECKSDVLPPDVIKWANVEGDNPIITDKNGNTNNLAHYNDSSDYDFKAIADIIEEQL